MKRIEWGRFARPNVKPQKGYAVFLGEDAHVFASYTNAGGSTVLAHTQTLETVGLQAFSRKGHNLSVAFSAQNIYADIGEFSSVSAEATQAHIRATVDKIRLFKDDYRLAYAKLNDIDAVRGSYSYLVIPITELDSSIEQVDSDNAIVDMFCPVEATLAAAMGSLGHEMTILVYEDKRFIRIIAAKDGIIYHLTTINSAESFDPLLDTVSGVHESISLLKNSYRQDVARVYTLGNGTISRKIWPSWPLRPNHSRCAEKMNRIIHIPSCWAPSCRPGMISRPTGCARSRASADMPGSQPPFPWPWSAWPWCSLSSRATTSWP